MKARKEFKPLKSIRVEMSSAPHMIGFAGSAKVLTIAEEIVGYSLFGLNKALTAQGKTADAAVVAERFERAWAEDGHELTSSRF